MPIEYRIILHHLFHLCSETVNISSILPFRSSNARGQLVVRQRNSEPLVDDPFRATSEEHPNPEPSGAEASEGDLHLYGIEQQRHQSDLGIRHPGYEP